MQLSVKYIRYIFSLFRFVMSNSMLFCFLLSHKSSTGNYKSSPYTPLYKMLRGLLIYWFKYPPFSASNISFNQFVKNLSTGSKSKSEREKNHSCRQEVRDIWCFLQVLFTIRNFNLKSLSRTCHTYNRKEFQFFFVQLNSKVRMIFFLRSISSLVSSTFNMLYIYIFKKCMKIKSINLKAKSSPGVVQVLWPRHKNLIWYVFLQLFRIYTIAKSCKANKVLIKTCKYLL